MITVTLQSREGQCGGFSAVGHAGYGPAGLDIVCAAVSTLTQSAVIALQMLTGDAVKVSDDMAGRMCVIIPEPDEKTQVVMAVMEQVLEALQKQYPENVGVCHE